MAEVNVQIRIKGIDDVSRVVDVESGHKVTASVGEQYEVLLDGKRLPMDVELCVHQPDLTLRRDGTELITFDGWCDLEDHAELIVANTFVRSGGCAVFSEAKQIGLLALGGTAGAISGANIWPTVSGIGSALLEWRSFCDRRWHQGY